MLEVEKYKTGIKIKKSNKGKFTSYCGGNVTSACILRGKNSSNPAIRKRATFAANARKWKHLNGGLILKVLAGTKTIKAGDLAKRHLLATKAPDWQSVDYGYNEMLRNGLDHSLAVAILGNTIQENAGSPKGQGIILWTGVPVPGGLREQWKAVIDSVNDEANVYDRRTDSMKNWWGKYNGQNGKQAQKAFRDKTTSIPEKTKIYSTSYIRPGIPELNKRVLFALQLDSIYNPDIKNKVIVLREQSGGRIRKGQGGFSVNNPMPLDNTRVLDNNGWDANQRTRNFEEMQRLAAEKQAYLNLQRLQPKHFLSARTPEDEARSQQYRELRDRAQFLRNTYNIWLLDPTRPYPKTDLEMIGAFNYAGTIGEPIRLGLAMAIGAGAVRLLPNAGRFIYNGAKNEAGMFAKSVTTAQGRQMWGQAASNFGKAVVDPRQWTIGKNWVGNTTFQLGKAELYGNVSGGLYLGLQGKPLDGSMTLEEQRRADAIASDSVNTWFEDLDPNAQYVIE